MKKRYPKKKKSNTPIFLIGLIVASIVFSFSIHVLSDNQAPLVMEDNSEELSNEQFIERLSPHAKELQYSYGVLPSIILGQAALESNWGKSTLASQHNNLFGIKAFGSAPKVNLETKEFINEQWVTINGDFRVYNTWEESMDDHTNLFVNGVTWNPRLYENVLLARNYREAARALQTAGYATDPNYAEKVISVIETHQLDRFDG